MSYSQYHSYLGVHHSFRKWFLLACIVLASGTMHAQDLPVFDTPVQQKKSWNEFDLKFTTVRIGMAAIYDYAQFRQNEAGAAQMDSAKTEFNPGFGWRDFRFFANGKLNTKRPIIWKVAAMWDGVTQLWSFRETGLLVGIPELKSHVFIGRSKEGYSLNKVQNGYSCWGNERQMSLDLIPIMTDGIRWYGYWPKQRFFWSIGAFTNAIYKQGPFADRFAIWEWQYSGRLGFRPIYTPGETTDLLHLGLNFRVAGPVNDTITVKSKPESNFAPYFINTGEFESDFTSAVGIEAYYRAGPFMVGFEGNVFSFQSQQAGNPVFPGAQLAVSYIFTGEIRPYLSDNSVFFFVNPKRSVFSGGPGAWELLLLYSIFDTNDGAKPGGSFWKVTPTINWYASKYLRLEFVYGFGVLNRFNMLGATQFFQLRFQLQVL
jgi:phosphate-selective porin OprO/OprP